MKDLNVTLIQSDLHWENKSENLKMFSKKISEINSPADLIILPEMFTTGFTMNPAPFAETMTGETVHWMKEKAKEKQCVITGSFVCEEDGHFYNRLVWMNDDGTCSIYNKRHLFSMGDEHNHYTSGNKKLMVELKGWKICPFICYDLRFPIWSRNLNKNLYDLVIYVANWPQKRSHAWKTLLQARAIENQSYAIGLNRVGNDVHQIYYSGDSAVINPKGEIISKIKSKEEATETITLSYWDLEEFRNIFPVLKDAD